MRWRYGTAGTRAAAAGSARRLLASAAAELAQRERDVMLRHLLAPAHDEVGVVERLGHLRGGGRHLTHQLLIVEPSPDELLRCVCRGVRARASAGDDDP